MNNDARALGVELPTTEELEAVFLDFVFARAETFSSYDVHGLGLSDTEVYRLVRSATEAVTESWDPDWHSGRVEAGRRGGQRSRRGPSTSADTVAGILDLWPDASHAEVAEILGISVATVKRRRRELRKSNESPTYVDF